MPHLQPRRYNTAQTIATLLRRQSSAAPCGHRLRCRYQNSGRAIASPATSPLPEEEGLGEKVELPLERETEGFEKNSLFGKRDGVIRKKHYHYENKKLQQTRACHALLSRQ